MASTFTRPLGALRKTLAAGRPSQAGLFSRNRRSGGRHVLRFETLESRHLLNGDGVGVLADPLVSIPEDLQGAPGQVVVAPVNIDDADGVRAAEIHIQYDTVLLDADNSGVRPGSVWPETNTSLFPNVDDAAGTIEVWVFGIEPLGPGAGSLIEIDFTVAEDVCEGQAEPTIETQLILTQVILNEGAIPAQTSDGLITILCNDPPTVELTNTVDTLPEDTDTTSRIKVADIVVTDDSIGTNELDLSGPDAQLFEVEPVSGTGAFGAILYLKAGTVLDHETQDELNVTVEVDDPEVGEDPDDTASLSIAISDVNEPPTVALMNTVDSIAENADTTSRVKVADIVVTDDALGDNQLSLVGPDAGMFEIDGTELYLKAGESLDHESNPVLDVTVQVDDPEVGTSADDTAGLAIEVTDVNEPPTVSLTNTVLTLPEDTDTSSRVKVADIVVTDDDLGTNDLSLSGPDAGSFEIDGTVLYLKAGTILDFETNPQLDVIVEVDDSEVGVTPDDTAGLSIEVTNVNETPSLTLPPRQATDINTPLVFSQVGGNPIRVDDVDAGDGELELTFDATNGSLPFRTFTGTLAEINVALDGLVFSPTEDFEGTATVTITVDDQGHSGVGGAQQVSGQVQIDVGRSATVSGFVYADTNRNDRPDEHEGVPGVLITLSGEGVTLETWTDDQGWYEFRELLGGTYTIDERQPYCMIDGDGNRLSNVEVAAAQDTVGQNFRELGLKPQYVYNRLYSTTVMPIGSEAWLALIRQIVADGERDAGRTPTSPPAVTQQILQQGSEVVVRGTNGDDDFAFVAADTGDGQHEVKLNGETHHFDASVVSSILFDGGLGVDTATLTGSTAADQFDVVAKSASLRGAGYVAEVVRTEKTTTNAGTGAAQDKAALADSAADDVLRAEIDSASLAAFYYEHVLREFEEITALSSHGGQDKKAVDEAIDYLLTTDGPWIDL